MAFVTKTDAEWEKFVQEKEKEDNEKSLTRMAWVKSLMKFGHSADKALEIAIDCERGDKHAKQWIARVNASNMNTMMKG